jgi:chaperonin GroES
MKLIPNKGMLIVKQDDAAATFREGKSKIIAPEAAKERPRRGTVVEAGEGTAYAAKDRVWFSAYAGNEVKIDEDTFLFMRGEDVLAKEG